MSKIALSGPAGGTATYTVTAPPGATDRVITLPDNTGTLLTTASTFGGTGPAFSAYASAATTLSNAGFTKILLAAEVFDTNSNFASSRFTPTIAGYYQIEGTASADPTGTAGSILLASLFFNGSRYKDGSFSTINNAQGGWSTTSSVIYFNGSTDYVELYAYMAGPASLTTQSSQNATHFSGALIRSAT
jgi:hypothetical protein